MLYVIVKSKYVSFFTLLSCRRARARGVLIVKRIKVSSLFFGQTTHLITSIHRYISCLHEINVNKNLIGQNKRLGTNDFSKIVLVHISPFNVHHRDRLRVSNPRCQL